MIKEGDLIYDVKKRRSHKDLRKGLSVLLDGLIITGLFLNNIILRTITRNIKLPSNLPPLTIGLISLLTLVGWYFLWIGLLYLFVKKQLRHGGVFNEKRI